MRHPRVVAGVALIALLAAVAVPGSVGSRGPSPALTTDPDLFQRIEVVGAIQGSVMTIQPLDPGARSDGTLDEGSTLVEPAPPMDLALSRSDVRQPQPQVGAIAKNPWRYDPEISWYGTGLYGNGTACGHRYTRTIMGVAHRSLPCGTMVSFRNPTNGRTVTVPVIDRGPYVAGRTWDLSRGACEAIGHCYTGPIQWRFAGR